MRYELVLIVSSLTVYCLDVLFYFVELSFVFLHCSPIDDYD